MLLNDMHTDWDDADNDVRDGIVTLHTNGSGYWSTEAKAVRVTEFMLHVYSNDDEDEDDELFGELCVHFNTNDWRVDKNGLIYTDKLFVKELRDYLTSIGLDASGVYYSEQGMQGDNYVSLDCDEVFIASYRAKNA